MRSLIITYIYINVQFCHSQLARWHLTRLCKADCTCCEGSWPDSKLNLKGEQKLAFPLVLETNMHTEGLRIFVIIKLTKYFFWLEKKRRRKNKARNNKSEIAFDLLLLLSWTPWITTSVYFFSAFLAALAATACASFWVRWTLRSCLFLFNSMLAFLDSATVPVAHSENGDGDWGKFEKEKRKKKKKKKTNPLWIRWRTCGERSWGICSGQCQWCGDGVPWQPSCLNTNDENRKRKQRQEETKQAIQQF